MIASRNDEKCEEFAKSLREQGYDAVGMALDLDSDDSIQCLVKEVMARYGKHNIRVNCIAPGVFGIEAFANDPVRKEFYDNYIVHCSLGRGANEDDIKGLVAFLAYEAGYGLQLNVV